MAFRRDRLRWFARKTDRRNQNRRDRQRQFQLHFEELERVVLLSTFNVTNTSASGAGSLAQAIADANSAGGGEINFNIGGGGPQVIPSSGFVITSPIVINGASQPNPGSAPSPLIQIDGPGTSGIGLWLESGSGGSVLAGLFITDFAIGIEVGSSGNTIGGSDTGDRNVISGNHYGVHIAGAGASNNVIAGNYIGTSVNGLTPLANTYAGVLIEATASTNTIGGTAAGAGNVISGNGGAGVYITASATSGNVVAGNLIGTDASGAAVLPNTNYGVVINGAASGNTIGGTVAGAKNVISGNGSYGVFLTGSGTTKNLVAGNWIGTNVSGTQSLGSPTAGVMISASAAGNRIGGTTSAARNVISGAQYGIELHGSGTANNVIEGNFIGTDASGTLALGNYCGVMIASGATNNLIGGTAAGTRNLISGNDVYGVLIEGAGTTGNLIQGNLLGTNSTGTEALGDTHYGVVIGGASDNSIGGTTAGAGNIIAFIEYFGVVIGGNTNDSATGNSVLGNSIFSAGLLGIDLANDGVTANTPGGPHSGPNLLQNSPVLTDATSTATATTVHGTLNSTPNTTFRIEFFANPTPGLFGNGQGRTYLGFCIATTDSNGNVTFAAALPDSSGSISATATDSVGNTSEFAHAISVRSVTDRPILTSATTRGDMSVTLTWTDVAGETGYQVERSANDDGTWTVIATVGAGVTTFNDADPHEAPLYAYRVFATNTGGNSEPSPVLRVTTPRSVPINLTATLASNDQIDLSWTDVSTDEQGFYIERSTDGGYFTPLANIPANISSFSYRNLLSGVTYHFRVRAYGFGVSSDFSNIASASTPPTLSTPANLVAAPVSSSQINLSWSTVAGTTSYLLERSADGITGWAVIASPNTAAYADTGLSDNTHYYYRVRASNSAGYSGYSANVDATTPRIPDIEGDSIATAFAPVLTRGTLYRHLATIGDGKYPSGDVDLYAVTVIAGQRLLIAAQARNLDDGGTLSDLDTYLRLFDASGNQLAFNDDSNNSTDSSLTYTAAAAGTYYVGVSSYASRIYNPLFAGSAASGGGIGGSGDYRLQLTLLDPLPPAAPTGLTATVVGVGQIDLSWTDMSPYEQGFYVERSTDGGGFTPLGNTSANGTSFFNRVLVLNGVTYHFRVRAYGFGVSSAFSNIASASTPPALSITPARKNITN